MRDQDIAPWNMCAAEPANESLFQVGKSTAQSGSLSYLDLFSRSTAREFCPAVPWQLHSLPWDRGIASLNAIAEILIFYSQRTCDEKRQISYHLKKPANQNELIYFNFHVTFS